MENRRKAINCLLVEENLETGYHKYMMDIKNVDGKIEVNVPAYGVDMQDALQRIVRNEFKQRVTKVYQNKIQPALMVFMVICWMCSVLFSTINEKHPEYAFYGSITMFSIVLVSVLYSFFKHNFR